MYGPTIEATPLTMPNVQKTNVARCGFAPTASVAAGPHVLETDQLSDSSVRSLSSAVKDSSPKTTRTHEQIWVANPNKTANANTAPKLLANPHAVNASKLPANPLAMTVMGVERSAA